MRSFSFEAIGTRWQIIYANNLASEANIEKKVKQRTEEFDKNYSRFRNDSLVSEWAKKAGEYKLPDDAGRLLYFYKKLYDATNGLVTPLIGKTMEQSGYDKDYSLISKKLTAPVAWEEAIEIKPNTIIVKLPVLLDFGAAGKGYLVDIIAHLLYTNDIDQFCIDAGGDMIIRDLPQKIGLEDPYDDTRILGTVEITNGALCASAGNRRKWKGYHHIINPKTLQPVDNVKATWVKAENAVLADGIATSLFFVSPEILSRTFNFEYAMIEGDDMKISNGFNAELFKG